MGKLQKNKPKNNTNRRQENILRKYRTKLSQLKEGYTYESTRLKKTK